MNAEASAKVELTAQRLLEAYKYLGAAHAQKTFAALTEGAKAWEAKVIRARFQELAREHDSSQRLGRDDQRSLGRPYARPAQRA